MKMVCIKCGIDKDIILFPKDRLSKDGYRRDCKDCRKKILREYRIKNKVKIKEVSRIWHLKNKEHNNTLSKEYYLKNSDSVKSKKREYYQTSKEKNSIRRKRYYLRHKDDLFFKIKESFRSLIKDSFRRSGFKKNSKTNEILGCSFEEFKFYLESKFESWMTWENKGLYNGELNYGWDIDHIIPISKAKNGDELIKLNHYTNLQPLCSKVNRDIKKDRYDNK